MSSGENKSRPVAASRHMSPLPVRLIVFVVLVLIALGAIWLIDRRAMSRQAEFEAQHTPSTTSNESQP